MPGRRSSWARWHAPQGIPPGQDHSVGAGEIIAGRSWLLGRLLGRQPAKVLFDDFTIVGRIFAADILQSLFAILLRQVAPARTMSDVPMLDVARRLHRSQ